MNARQIIEAESPKRIFQRLPRQRWPLYPGKEVSSATGDTRYIIRQTLALLKEIDPAKYQAELDGYELTDYLAGNADLPAETDPEWYLFEHLFSVLTKYCPPFTYFGFLEADGSVGCWPYDGMSMEMADDKVTVQEGSEPDWNGITTPYLYLDNTAAGGGRDFYETRTRSLLWSW